MKKIDFHIHTVATQSDSHFEFSLDTFKAYVKAAKLAAVAVTNHNIFDLAQFRVIEHALPITVFAGIEIDVESGHVLIISDGSDLNGFATKAAAVSHRITSPTDTMSIAELVAIYPDLERYLVIPHTDKAPAMNTAGLSHFSQIGAIGEVDSQKKFIRALKDVSKPTPVLFSDARMADGMSTFPARQTFIDCGIITIPALKECLRDKAKVALSEKDGNRLWPALPDGQMLSSGLNVLVGGRSTGKTHTLDRICETQELPKYIRQFTLVQRSEEDHKRDFETSIERERSSLVDDHFQDFKRVLDEVLKINLEADSRAVQQYISSLLKAAEETGRHDAFSKAVLFGETEFSIGSTKELNALINSVRNVIENIEHRHIVEKHVDIGALKRLAVELIELLRATDMEGRMRSFVNGMVHEVKQLLQVRTSAAHIKNIDLYQVSFNAKKIERFCEIVALLRRETVIHEDTIQGFRVEARRERFSGAMEVKRASGTTLAFSECFAKYSQPYEYMCKLRQLEDLPSSEVHKLFAKISYKILNRDGFEVSGGERSEFRLLQEIKDAQNYDILLIDEPESSFDNLFLKSDVNKLIKDISATMPVVVVTHNNTVGASIGADYILHTAKEVKSGVTEYRIYSGRPSDQILVSADGHSVRSHSVLMNSLEGGVEAYRGRRESYEAVED